MEGTPQPVRTQLQRPLPLSEVWAAAGVRGAPTPSCPTEMNRSAAYPAGPAHFLRRLGVYEEPASSHPLSKALAQNMLRPAPRAQALQLLVSAQDDEFTQFDPISTQLAPELVKRGLDLLRLRNRMAAAVGWHKSKCNTSATPDYPNGTVSGTLSFAAAPGTSKGVLTLVMAGLLGSGSLGSRRIVDRPHKGATVILSASVALGLERPRSGVFEYNFGGGPLWTRTTYLRVISTALYQLS